MNAPDLFEEHCSRGGLFSDFGILVDEEGGRPGESEKRAARPNNMTRADDLITTRTNNTVNALCMHYMHRLLSETRHGDAAWIIGGSH